MIGINGSTFETVDDWGQFVQRAARALTTPIGTRQKRPLYGCKATTRLSANMNDSLLILIQSDCAEAFYNAANGIDDFVPGTVLAQRGEQGVVVRLAGVWNNRKMTFEVQL
ncbi:MULTISPECIES: phage baseplate protein [Pseudomonas syringae group]|uniref:phage baseplate protein n=1 Tax=Pseudomonas syringae group TaxID=136849 RepID=UPI000F01A4E2|nr:MULTISPECIES: phage baseplate protein [Pseudomonas syringae group]RXU06998.1 phage baseplate protein [Pseudomonas syringae]RXU07029.1 phage baseplate protein [Pseudomonas syringae]